jgi:hypothetical protein
VSFTLITDGSWTETSRNTGEAAAGGGAFDGAGAPPLIVAAANNNVMASSLRNRLFVTARFFLVRDVTGMGAGPLG